MPNLNLIAMTEDEENLLGAFLEANSHRNAFPAGTVVEESSQDPYTLSNQLVGRPRSSTLNEKVFEVVGNIVGQGGNGEASISLGIIFIENHQAKFRIKKDANNHTQYRVIKRFLQKYSDGQSEIKAFKEEARKEVSRIKFESDEVRESLLSEIDALVVSEAEQIRRNLHERLEEWVNSEAVKLSDVPYFHSKPAVKSEMGDGVEFFLIMRYFPGVTLNKLNRDDYNNKTFGKPLIHLQAPFTFIDRLNIINEMFWKVKRYLHDRNLIHKDLKPTNLITDVSQINRFTIHPIDLGSAVYANSTKTNSTYGTPGYMAPEVNLGLPVTVSADIYSLGILAKYILAGPNYKEEFDKHLNQCDLSDAQRNEIINLIEAMTSDLPNRPDILTCIETIEKLLLNLNLDFDESKKESMLGDHQLACQIRAHMESFQFDKTKLTHYAFLEPIAAFFQSVLNQQPQTEQFANMLRSVLNITALNDCKTLSEMTAKIQHVINSYKSAKARFDNLKFYLQKGIGLYEYTEAKKAIFIKKLDRLLAVAQKLNKFTCQLDDVQEITRILNKALIDEKHIMEMLRSPNAALSRVVSDSKRTVGLPSPSKLHSNKRSASCVVDLEEITAETVSHSTMFTKSPIKTTSPLHSPSKRARLSSMHKENIPPTPRTLFTK